MNIHISIFSLVLIASCTASKIDRHPEHERIVIGKTSITIEPHPRHRLVADIRSHFDKIRIAVNSLYESYLIESPETKGEFSFSFLIEPEGDVSELKLVESELGINKLNVAILEVIQGVNLGAGNFENIEVHYTFMFTPE